MLRTVSLFSGAGGMDFGFEQAGYEIVFANELNVDSAKTWVANRPDNTGAMHVGDLAEHLDELSLAKDVDVLVGGPPCQGFSVAGKMDVNDSRSKLIFTYLEAVEKARPRVFLMENVSALANSNRWKDVRRRFTEHADRIGYSISWCVYDASDYGVPEHRKRMLLVGVKEGAGSADAFHDAMMSRVKSPENLRDVLQSVGKYGSEANPATCTAKVSIAKKPVLRGHAYSGMLVNGAGRPIDLSRPAPTLTASMGGNNTPIIDENNLYDSSVPHWFETLYDLLIEGATYSEGVPTYIRRLTLKEAAAIQTFPKSYRFEGSVCSAYRQIGNAVPCLLAQNAAESLREAFFND